MMAASCVVIVLHLMFSYDISVRSIQSFKKCETCETLFIKRGIDYRVRKKNYTVNCIISGIIYLAVRSCSEDKKGEMD